MSPTRSPCDVPDATKANDVIGAVLDIGDDRDFSGAVGVGEVDERAKKFCFQKLQESYRTMKRRVPSNVLEVFTLAMKLIEEPVESTPEAMEGRVSNAGLTMADALKK